jgi:hypothetical protein
MIQPAIKPNITPAIPYAIASDFMLRLSAVRLRLSEAVSRELMAES